MNSRHRNLRSRIRILSTASLLTLLLGFTVALYISWQSLIRNTMGELQREACTTSTLVRGTLVDASKIIDTARSRLEEALRDAPLEPKQAHDILRSVVEAFSIYNSADSFGLLLLLNQDGKLIARSGEYPSTPIDLSDRYYYRSLRDDPSRKYSIGKLRNAATTGKMVFHLSMPIHERDGSFAGVVAVQIDELELTGTIKETLNGEQSAIRVQDPSGQTILLYPPPERAPTKDDPANMTVDRLFKESPAHRDSMCIRGGAAGFPKTVYVGYERDPLFGFYSWSSVTKARMCRLFLSRNHMLISASLLAITAIGILFLGLYRQAARLENALEDANLDPMTLIGNRRSMEAETERLWRDAARSGDPISLLFIDIDHFKDFNDIHGHAVGDRALKAVARFIQLSLQRPLDLCCRWGGEEFVAILPDTRQEQAVIVAERIRERVSQMTLNVNGVLIPKITLSVGIASSDRADRTTADELISQADQAMLRAKAEGRDRTVVAAETKRNPETLTKPVGTGAVDCRNGCEAPAGQAKRREQP